jgi:anti-sigma factor RsiW
MKLVETELPHGDEEVPDVPRPPRPPRRRVYVSLVLTTSVLIATVAAIYIAFPKRDNELLTAALEVHQTTDPMQLEHPTGAELTAWTVGALGEPVPWPASSDEIKIIGTRRMKVLRKPVAIVVYEVGTATVSFLALRAYDAPPRKYRREEDGALAVSWRHGPWTFVAVGPAGGAGEWRARLGVP